MSDNLILVGDIGGTNTRLKLYKVKATDSTEGGKVPGELIKHVEYENEKFKPFDDVVKTFLAAEPKTTTAPAAGCLAVAGGGELRQLYEPRLEDLGRRAAEDVWHPAHAPDQRLCRQWLWSPHAGPQQGVRLPPIGAQAGGRSDRVRGCGHRAGRDVHDGGGAGARTSASPLRAATPSSLRVTTSRWATQLSEEEVCGEEPRLSGARHLGAGLAGVYEFLAAKFPAEVNKAVHAEFEAATDLKGKVVAMHSKKGDSRYCSLCDRDGHLPRGLRLRVRRGVPKVDPFGMYVAGGLTPKNINRLTEPNSPFMEAFYDKGRLSPLLKRIPLYAVLVEDIGQRGAHLVACKQLQLVRSGGSSGGSTKPALKLGGAAEAGVPMAYATVAALCAGAFAIGLAFARR